MTDHTVRAPAPTLRAASYRSQVAHLTAESLQTLRGVGDGDLGEFAVLSAGIAFLLWKHFGYSQVAFRTPPMAEHRSSAATEIPLLIEMRAGERVAHYLERVAGIVETSYNEPTLGIAHLTTIGLVDDQVHSTALESSHDELQFRLRRASGEIEIRYTGAVEPFLIASFAANLAALLPQLARFDESLSQVEWLAPSEQRLLQSFNESASQAWDHSTVVAMFEAQVARTPSAPALITDSSLTTYASLNEQANRLAHHLREAHRVGPESMVGVLLDRSELMIVAVLGILKAGGAFVPIDTSYPRERIDYILSDTDLKLLITHSSHSSRQLAFSGHIIALDVELPRIAVAVPPGNPPPVQPQHLAYVLYTSGSTGRPKGCLLEHRNLLNYIAWAVDYYFPEATTGSFGLYSSLCFDFTLTNIFCPLVRGKSLRIYSQSQSIDTILSRAFQAGSGVDTMKLTPSHVYILEQMKMVGTGIRKVILGGEELTPRHVEILRHINPAMEIYNEYGPTEATVGCIVKCIESEHAPVLIGRPISNTRVYILDELGMPTPVGVRGEIHVAGDGLARGYHQRPDITAARFIHSSFVDGARVYRTGDIGRWLPDGEIQSYGRIDDQVKIRGHRVELGEVENTLAEHEDVNAAAVILREDSNGVRKLAAYVKGAPDLTAAVLKAHLAAKLPDYMVPADIVFLHEFPLNANGKLDRARLPAPESLHTAEPHESQDLTPVQETLRAIWREILNTRSVELTSRFFDLGGDSLLAIRLASRIWKAFSVEISLDEIFERQSLEELAEAIDSASRVSSHAAPVISPRARDGELLLSSNQQRLWFLAQLEGPSAAYNLSSALRLAGRIDLARLNFALSEIVRRHEVLRTTFPDIDGRPLQSITSPHPIVLRPTDVSTLDEALRHAALEGAQPFDLSSGPLYRVALYRVRDEEHVLSVVMHHIIADAWSSKVLMDELAAHYEQRSLAELPIQYADYAAWQREYLRSEAAQKQLAARRKALVDAPELLELPTDRPRPATQSLNGASVLFDLDKTLTRALRSKAQESDATLFMVLFTGFALLLSRYSRQKDVVIGSPIANRGLRETEPLIGFFVNTLALRVDLTGNPTLRELLARVRRVALESYAAQEIPFEQIVEAIRPERNLSHTPLFQVMFAHETSSPETLRTSWLEVTPLSVATSTAKFDLTLYMQESGEDVAGTLEYNTDLFDRDTAERMVDHLRQLFAAAATNADVPIEKLPMLSAAERHRIVVEWNATQADYPSTPIHRLFEQQVERDPAAIAAVFEDTSLSYAELNAQANHLAHRLIEEGVTPNALVGVAMERSLEMIVALLAILKAGGAYVPIDPDYPAERIRFMLENSRVRWLLTQSALIDRLPATDARLIRADLQRPLPPDARLANPVPFITPESLAYMIYTSGSTGRPKGALNSHGAITNRLVWMQEAYRLTPSDVVLQKTPMSFDVSVWEFFWPLIAGARLVLARPGGHRESDYLIDLIRQHSVTTTHFVPSMLRAFLDAPGVEGCISLRRVICSGEALAPDLQEKLFLKLPAELHNLYGPTEAAVDVSFWACRRERSHNSVPIGRPIANTKLYIVDEAFEPCPIGVPGELLIGGIAVGAGYYREPELTAKKFVRDPFSEEPKHRLYRTGDLARYRSDGNIEFLGRLDHQIKLRGFRVELGEIETSLRSHPLVKDCVVIADQDAANVRLVAYVTPAISGVENNLREFLSTRLPEYMVPSVFVALEALPLLPNGKLDRKALPKPAAAQQASRAHTPPNSPREILLAKIWQDVLGLATVGVHDNFFELGGDSILSIQVVSRASRAGLAITAKQFFHHQTIAGLAAAAAESSARAELVNPLGEAPLTPVQHWFFDQHLPTPSRFNQTVLIEVPFDVDVSRLERAVRQVHAHHDALRLRFKQTANVWAQEVAPPADDGSIFATEELQDAAQLQTFAQEAERSIDILQGRLIAVRLFRFKSERSARLFVAAHHLAIDGVSWRILLDDLRTAYNGQPLPAKSKSFREWTLHLQKLAQTSAVLDQLSAWRDLLAHDPPRLPIDHLATRAPNLVSDTASVTFDLSVPDTERLLRELPRTHAARINDVLLTALARAFHSQTGQRRVLVDLESHGRHDSDGAVDLSRTVGWFTSIHPVVLNIDPVHTPAASLSAIQQQMLRIPSDGLSYSLLRYLSPDESVRRELSDLPRAEILFNYHGQIDTALSASADWRLAAENLASLREGTDPRSHLFEIIAAVVDGKLRVDWSYNERIHDSKTIQSLASAFEHELHALILSSPKGLARDAGKIRYELSPLQQGILFHALYDRDPAAYFQQFSFTIEGQLDVPAFQKAWSEAVERHDVLRTSFEWEHLEHPMQTVSSEARVPWETLELRSAEAFDAFLIQDRKRGFRLQSAPLFRCTLFKESSGRYRFCWSAHHIILDGWSTSVLMTEVFENYLSLTGSQNRARPPAPAYRRYIEWLSRRSRAEDEAYWRTELRGFRKPTQVFSPTAPSSKSAITADELRREQTLLLEESLTSQIDAQVRAHHLTLNVVLRGVWTMLLSRYSNSDDVLFGVTVSGRPATLEGVESMVGLFINTIPARIRVHPKQSFVPWLREIHSAQAAMEHHSHSSLADIQRWSEVPPALSLFEALLVFENFPDGGPPGLDASGIAIRNVHTFAESSYPLTLTVSPGSRIGIRLSYDSSRFSAEIIAQMLGHIRALLERFALGTNELCEQLLALIPAVAVPREPVPLEAPKCPAPEPAAHSTPLTPDERTLLSIWENVLGCSPIKVTDDYFDLGGDSLLAVRLMAKVEQAFKRQLPISQLFENPTVAQLAVALRQESPASGAKNLVRIRAGGPSAPLFLLPGAGGNVLYFHPLANHLPETHAVYALEAIGLDGSEPALTSVEAIAARHVDSIWPVAGAGPYYLAGHSFGASVALEMSRQLLARGASVGRLAIFDAYAPLASAQNAYWQSWDDVEWLLAIAHDIGTFLGATLDLTRDDLASRSEQERIAFMMTRISSRGAWFSDLGPERLRAYLNVYQANYRAVYVPTAESLDIPITLFRSSVADAQDVEPSPEFARLRADAAWGWSRFSSLPVEVVDVPGSHLAMLLEPHVSELAQHLDASLNQSSQ